MKKQKKARGSDSKPVRTLDDAALAGANGGGGDPPPTGGDGYIGHQHNETIVRARAPRRAARR